MAWRLIWTGLLLLLILALPPPASGSEDDLIDRLMVHINQTRIDNHVEPLTWNMELTWAAGQHVEDMLARSYFAHDAPDGLTPAMRAERSGYGSFVGENLIKGSADPSEIVRLWMQSEPHRANLLRSEYRDVGLWTAGGVTGALFGARETEPAGTRIARMATRQLGAPYVWGGFWPSGFDCAGFVWWSYREAGIDLASHYIPTLATMGSRVEWGEWRPGDLLIFENTYKDGLSHVAIYVRDWQIVHAVQPAVRIDDVRDPYWRAHYAGGSRPWE